MTNSNERNDFSGAERWRELDILDQKQLLEVSTGMKCPLSDEELIEKQKQGWCLSEAGLYLRREKWHKDIKEVSSESRGGLPTVRDVLFQLVPDFARMPVENRVSLEFTEKGVVVHNANRPLDIEDASRKIRDVMRYSSADVASAGLSVPQVPTEIDPQLREFAEHYQTWFNSLPVAQQKELSIETSRRNKLSVPSILEIRQALGLGDNATSAVTRWYEAGFPEPSGIWHVLSNPKKPQLSPDEVKSLLNIHQDNTGEQADSAWIEASRKIGKEDQKKNQ